MPYTAKQRRFFHAAAKRGEPGMSGLAKEADSYAKKGKEKEPPNKSAAKKAVKRGKKG